jgi:hypothetical protein
MLPVDRQKKILKIFTAEICFKNAQIILAHGIIRNVYITEQGTRISSQERKTELLEVITNIRISRYET